MLILLPAGALGAAWLAMASRGGGLRRSLLWTALGGGLFVLLSNETLSLVQALAKPQLVALWALALVGAVASIRPAQLRKILARQEIHRRSPLVWAAALACASSLAAAFLSAVLGPPNMVDVLTYHMPRVVYWQVNQSVDFYPTSYYQQLALQPFSEYAMLQLYALAESDRFVQLAQWSAWLLAIVAASLVAKRLGADWRGQMLAAGLCATLPSGAVQASGAKPDVMAAAWLLAAIYFALGAEDKCFGWREASGVGIASGLALLSKGTAYLFGAGMAPFLLLGMSASARVRILRNVPLMAVAALLINAPHYARNYSYNGHPVGEGSARGDGVLRIANERLGLDVTLSNVLRNLPLQLPVRPQWNQAVFKQVVAMHEALGLDPSDPETTWAELDYRPASVSTHEGEAANVRHLLLAGLMLVWLLWRRRWDATAGLLLGCFAGGLVFCALLKWQPWHARMHLPLFVAAAPAMAVFVSAWRPRWVAVGFLVWLTWALHPFLLHNGLRPLAGPRPVYAMERFDQFFLDWPRLRVPYRLGADWVSRRGCKQVGIDASLLDIEYPLMARMRARDFSVRFRQEGVANESVRYADRVAVDDVCAVFCSDCSGIPEKHAAYARFGAPVRFNNLLVFVE